MEDATVSKFKGEWSGVKDRRGFERVVGHLVCKAYL